MFFFFALKRRKNERLLDSCEEAVVRSCCDFAQFLFKHEVVLCLVFGISPPVRLSEIGRWTNLLGRSDHHGRTEEAAGQSEIFDEETVFRTW